MSKGLVLFGVVLFCAPILAQADLQKLQQTGYEFDRAVAQKGSKAAYLQYLSDDGTIFRPDPVNGKQYWNGQKDDANFRLTRKATFADVSANGMLGYTTGDWRLDQKGKGEGYSKFGQYVTIWEKRQDGKYYATIDIGITHDKLTAKEADPYVQPDAEKDLNKRGWSPADSSMDFLRISMQGGGLGKAYEEYAAKDVRLLIERLPPITKKKRVIAAMNQYRSIEFPTKVAMFQAADMAYTWHPCQYANSNEGIEKGNCLHIWKLRDNKWSIVLGVFAPQPNDTVPKLQPRQKRLASQ